MGLPAFKEIYDEAVTLPPIVTSAQTVASPRSGRGLAPWQEEFRRELTFGTAAVERESFEFSVHIRRVLNQKEEALAEITEASSAVFCREASAQFLRMSEDLANAAIAAEEHLRMRNAEVMNGLAKISRYSSADAKFARKQIKRAEHAFRARIAKQEQLSVAFAEIAAKLQQRFDCLISDADAYARLTRKIMQENPGVMARLAM